MPLVVLDATLLATATAFAGSSYRSWPDIPPTTSNPEADCISVIASSPRHGNDFGLVVSERLLRQVADTLRASVGLRPRDIDDYLLALLHFSRRSGGEIVEDRPSSTMLPAHLDIPLSLAQQKQAVLVAAHPDLRALQNRGPEWGPDRIALIGPREFSVRADAARRARRG